MFHSENNTEIMKSHIVSLYKRLFIFIVKLQVIIIQAIINIYCETTSDYYTSDYNIYCETTSDYYTSDY